jgi:protein associated with RNAse G/E
MKKIKIVSRKYGGALRDEYAAFLYANDQETLRVYSPPGTMAFDHRKGMWLRAPDGLLEIYFKARWYAVWHVCEQNSQQNLTYAHISMPATLTEDTLEWIDLDLDYRVYLDGSLERLDEQEFGHNIQALKYPADVVAQARAACEEVERLYQRQAFPFNYREQVLSYRALKAGYSEARAG